MHKVGSSKLTRPSSTAIKKMCCNAMHYVDTSTSPAVLLIYCVCTSADAANHNLMPAVAALAYAHRAVPQATNISNSIYVHSRHHHVMSRAAAANVCCERCKNASWLHHAMVAVHARTCFVGAHCFRLLALLALPWQTKAYPDTAETQMPHCEPKQKLRAVPSKHTTHD
jgi:hypothetical protein